MEKPFKTYLDFQGPFVFGFHVHFREVCFPGHTVDGSEIQEIFLDGAKNPM